MLHTIQIGTRLQDNGDGGYTLYMYPTYEDAVAAKRKEVERWSKWGHRKYTTEEILQKFDENYDEFEYECGYLGKDSLKIKIDEEGIVHLAEECSFHAGQ